MLRQNFVEMTNEQRRQLIDVQQTYVTWRSAVSMLDGLGSIQLRRVKGQSYVTLAHGRVRKSLGRATPSLLRQKVEHDAKRKEARTRVQSIGKRLATMAPVNRALQLGRLPTIVARIAREIDREGLLGSHIILAGTNALHAYEVACGVFIGQEHVATTDADLVWDGVSNLSLASRGMKREGMLGLLRRVDRTFSTDYGYNATNKDGFIVDLICPENNATLSQMDGRGLSSTPIAGVEWLLQSPHYEQVAIGADGLPVRLAVPEPRTFALHKLWVSQQQSRQIPKRPRDRMHAEIVAELVGTFTNQALKAADMPWLPEQLNSLIPKLTRLSQHR